MKDDDKNRWKMTIETNEDNNIMNKKMIIETEWNIVIGNGQKKWKMNEKKMIKNENKEKQKMNKKRNNKEQKMTRSKPHKKNEVSEKRNNVINKQEK